jgi:hypothetical protein
MKRWILAAASVLLPLAATPAWADMQVHVLADHIRVVDTKSGEAAKAEGNVTITIPGEVRIRAPKAQLIKGADGKLAKAVFPGWVEITDIKPGPKGGTWKAERNQGGFYDFKTRAFTELNPQGVFEFEAKPSKGQAK